MGEGERLQWLAAHGIPVPTVVECGPGLLVTTEVPGRSVAEPWTDAQVTALMQSPAELTHQLHELPVESCPHDNRLATTVWTS